MKVVNSSDYNQFVFKRIETILSIVYNLLCQALNSSPPLGEKDIEIINDPVDGPIVYWPLNAENYKIGLAVEGDYPLQIIYQVAHELSHIFIDPRLNGLFVEILCQKIAIDFIEILGGSFLPQNSVTNYLTAIKDKCITKYQVDIDKLDLDWLRNTYRQKSLNNDILDREFNNIVAYEIKKQTDCYGKFKIITQIRHSIKDIDEIQESQLIPYAIVDFDKLENNLDSKLGGIIRVMFR